MKSRRDGRTQRTMIEGRKQPRKTKERSITVTTPLIIIGKLPVFNQHCDRRQL